MVSIPLKSVVAVATLLLCLSSAEALKILGVLHFGGPSHFIVTSSLMKGLANKGHEVTVLSPFPQKEPIENYHDIPTPSVLTTLQSFVASLLDINKHSIYRNIFIFYDMGYKVTESFLNEPGVQNLMKSNNTFDVVICEVFMGEALYGLADHFNAPLIGISSFGANSWSTDMIGSPSPPSYVPNTFLPHTEHMTLLERISNLAFNSYDRLIIDFSYLPRQETLFKQHFPHLKRSMNDIKKNTALVLLNTHVSLAFSRPYMPNQVEVGGMHINPQRKSLPADIQKFLDEARNGAIYFSMGSNLKSRDLPLEKRQVILNTFRGLKQRVLWKFEDPNLEEKPDNVFISSWFPQDDILAHPNVRLFITHGGLLSTTESIYHGKPVVGIPVFADQFLNMARAEKNGYGITLDFGRLTEASFKTAIAKIFDDPSYTKAVRDISARYHDQPLKPLDLAIFWVEHVAKHDGATYMHCAGLDMNFIQYHNIDAMLILYGGLVVLLLLIILFLRYVIRGILNLLTGKSKTNKKLKRQ